MADGLLRDGQLLFQLCIRASLRSLPEAFDIRTQAGDGEVLQASSDARSEAPVLLRSVPCQEVTPCQPRIYGASSGRLRLVGRTKDQSSPCLAARPVLFVQRDNQLRGDLPNRFECGSERGIPSLPCVRIRLSIFALKYAAIGYAAIHIVPVLWPRQGPGIFAQGTQDCRRNPPKITETAGPLSCSPIVIRALSWMFGIVRTPPNS